MSEDIYVPNARLSDAIAWNLNAAMQQIAPGGGVFWEIGWREVKDNAGNVVIQGMLIVTGSNPAKLNTSLIVTSLCDLRQFTDPQNAVNGIRHLVEMMTMLQQRILRAANGQS